MEKIISQTKPYYLGLMYRASLQIFDLSGKLLHSQNLSSATASTTVDVQQLQNGIYLLALYADGISLAQSKIAIQH